MADGKGKLPKMARLFFRSEDILGQREASQWEDTTLRIHNRVSEGAR